MRKLRKQKSILYIGGLLIIISIIVLLTVNVAVAQTEDNVTPPSENVTPPSENVTPPSENVTPPSENVTRQSRVLATIIVSPSTATLNVSENKMFTATASDEIEGSMPGVNLSWTSSNTTVGTVNPSSATTDIDGTATTTFTALAPGTTMVIATSRYGSDSATVTVVTVPPPSENGTIAGTVTNASSGLAISGATITADGMTAITGADGSYSISIAAGTYTVTASATGYKTNTTTGVVVTSGNVTIQDFALTPTVAPVVVPVLTTITVSPSTATLNVNGTQAFNATALDQNNTPMAGVNITWTVSDPTVGNVSMLDTVTGADGTTTTTFTALAAENTTMNAMNGIVSGSATVTVVRKPSSKNGTIAGTVTNASSGLAISGATITADGMTAITGANGSYSIDIAPDTYNVAASATGYQNNTPTGVVVTMGNVTTLNPALIPIVVPPSPPPSLPPSPPPSLPPSPPSPLSFNNISIQSGQFFDFNNGTKTNDVDKADIWWGLLNGQKYLVPKNDATYVIKGNINFETENCNLENYSSGSSKKINSTQIPNGTVICFRINRISSVSSVPTPAAPSTINLLTIGSVVTEDIKFTKIQVNADDLDILRGLTSSGPSVQKVLAFLKLNSTPRGAGIWIDGNDKGRITPDTIRFEGEQIRSLHNYTLSLSRYRSYNETFNFLKGPTINREVTLIPTSSKSAPRDR